MKRPSLLVVVGIVQMLLAGCEMLFPPSNTPQKVATPTFSPAGGTYTTDQSVTISTTTSGATIYYTTDGTTPTIASTQYSGAISVAGNSTSMTIKAIAKASGFDNSSVGSATYTIGYPAAATPTFSPAGGTYTTDQSVTISTTTSGATIYYTADGTTPTTASTKYSGSISVAGDETTKTIKAIAIGGTGQGVSTIGAAIYSISYNAPNSPSINPNGGTYTNGDQNVTITGSTSGETIYYTLDGSTPTLASLQYMQPVSTADAVSVSTNSGIIDASILRSKLDAGFITEAEYQQGILAIPHTKTIKAIIVGSTGKASPVAAAVFTISDTTPIAATPTFSPAGGTYATDQSVTISTTTSGAAIYYTTDGTTPTTASTQYSGAISVAGNATSMTIKAIAVASGYKSSVIATAAYTISYVSVTGVTMSPASKSAMPGDIFQLSAVVAPSTANNKSISSWSSSDTAVATVSSSGLVSAVGLGTATITVTTEDQSKTATCAVTVTTIDNIVTNSFGYSMSRINNNATIALSVTFNNKSSKDVNIDQVKIYKNSGATIVGQSSDQSLLGACPSGTTKGVSTNSFSATLPTTLSVTWYYTCNGNAYTLSANLPLN